MNCPGCDKHFTRMGALIAHIELTECRIAKKDVNFNFGESGKEKEAVYENQRNIRNYVDFGRSEGEPGADNGPKPLVGNYAKVHVAAASAADNTVMSGKRLSFKQFLSLAEGPTLTMTL
jgi:hypothetical protein